MLREHKHIKRETEKEWDLEKKNHRKTFSILYLGNENDRMWK